MQEKKNSSLRKIRFYFLAAAILIGVPNIFGFYNGQTGHLLVATNKTANDPNFSQSVIYIFYNGIWGAQGIVINEPLSKEVVERETSLEEQSSYALFKGGPVAFPEFKTVALNIPSKASRWRTQPLSIVDYSSYKHYLDLTMDEKDPNNDQRQEKEHEQLYFGFAGWVTGQLESELRRGIWRVLECDNLDFDGVHGPDLWQQLSGDLQTTTCKSKN